MGGTLETENCKGLLPVHFGFETAFSPLLGSTSPTKKAPSDKRATGNSGGDSSHSEDDWRGHLRESEVSTRKRKRSELRFRVTCDLALSATTWGVTTVQDGDHCCRLLSVPLDH